MGQLFLVTSYRDAGGWFGTILNSHPRIACTTGPELIGVDSNGVQGEQFLDACTELLEGKFDAEFVGNVGGLTAAGLMHHAEQVSNASRNIRAVNLTMHPFRRIELLYRQYRRNSGGDQQFVHPELESIEGWQDYLEYSLEIYEGQNYDEDDKAFVRAVFDTCNDMVDYSVPLQQVQTERLATDIDFTLNVIHELTDNHVEFDSLFCTRLRRAMFQAHSVMAPASYLEIAKSWSNWRRQLVRRAMETRNVDQIYKEFGYDVSFIAARGDHTPHFISFSEPYKPRVDLRFRTVYPPINVEHALAGELVGSPRFVASTGAWQPFPNLRRTIVNQDPPADTLRVGDILVSIHMQSNRPENFVRFLDELESKTDNPQRVEVIVKIDDDDQQMQLLLAEETGRRKVRVKPVISPNPDGFFGLWKSMEDLLSATDPDAYYLINLNDEMYFVTKGWDSVLLNSVGVYPDHIFRVRTSVERFRNYHDHWEAGFANDTAAFFTKRWIELVGGWCPCNGPDSFQQSVAYYLSYNDRFRHPRPYRDLIANDIEISGHGANRGFSGAPLRKRIREGLKAWWVLMSHEMQEEASRRAGILDCHIFGIDSRIAGYEVRDRRWRGVVQVYDPERDEVVHSNHYRLSRWRMGWERVWRCIFFRYYAGGGTRVGKGLFKNAWYYLYHRYEFCFQIVMALEDARVTKHPFGPPSMGQINEPTKFKILSRGIYWILIIPHHKIMKPVLAVLRPIALFFKKFPRRVHYTLNNPEHAVRLILSYVERARHKR